MAELKAELKTLKAALSAGLKAGVPAPATLAIPAEPEPDLVGISVLLLRLPAAVGRAPRALPAARGRKTAGKRAEEMLTNTLARQQCRPQGG